MKHLKLEILSIYGLMILTTSAVGQETKRQPIPIGMFNAYALLDERNVGLSQSDLREVWQGVPTNWQGGYYPYEACNLVQHYWPKKLLSDTPLGQDPHAFWWTRFLQEVYEQGNENGEVRLRAIVGPLFRPYEAYGEQWLMNFIQQLCEWEQSAPHDGVIAGWYLAEEPMGGGSRGFFSPDVFEEMVRVIEKSESEGGFRRHERYVDVTLDGANYTPLRMVRFTDPADVVMLSASTYIWMTRSSQPVFDPSYRDLAWSLNQARSLIFPNRDLRGLPRPKIHIVLQAYDPRGFGQPTHWEMRQQIREVLSPDFELLGNESVEPADGIWFFWWPGLTFENTDRISDWQHGRRFAEAIELGVLEAMGMEGESRSVNQPTRTRFAFPPLAPFNPNEGIIPYELAQSGRVEIEIFNIDGSSIRKFNMGLQSTGRLHRFGGPRWYPYSSQPDGAYIFRLSLDGVLKDSVEVEVQRQAYLSSLSHTPNVWSNDNRITVEWHPPPLRAGLSGFSFVWSESQYSSPPRNVLLNARHRSLTSAPLSDGDSHYFHLRNRDENDTWGGTSHLGPFLIDTVPPSLPTDAHSTSHEIEVWSTVNTIELTWSEIRDDASGLRGYSVLWDNHPLTFPREEINVGRAVTALSTPPLVDGVWYLHQRAVDAVGNWTKAMHLGPFMVDTRPPEPPFNLESSSHKIGTWSNKKEIELTWNAASDETSGIANHLIVWDTMPMTIPSPDSAFHLSSAGPLSHMTYRSPSLEDGDTHYVHLSAIDNVGLLVPHPLHLGPFQIDTVPPSDVPNFSAFLTTDSAQPLNLETWLTAPQITFAWAPSTDSHSEVEIYEITQIRTETGAMHRFQVDPNAPLRWTPVVVLGDGEWNVRIRPSDGAGNWGNEAELTLKLDTVVPTPTISSPSHPNSEHWYANPKPTVAWTIADDLSGIAGYFGEWDQQQGTIPTSPIDSGESRSALQDGVWYFHLRTSDNAGNLSDVVHYKVKIDRATPATPIVRSPTHIYRQWTSEDTVDLRWVHFTTLSGQIRYSYVLDGASDTIPDDEPETTHGSRIEERLDDGIWYFHLKAISPTGVQGRTAHYQIRIDTTSPMITLETPESGKWIREAITSYSGQIGDEGSGIDQGTLEYRLGRSDWKPFVNEVSEGWRDTDEIPHFDEADGVSLQVRVRDGAGNIGFSEEINLRVDRKSPSLVVSHSTHPDQTRWYANREPILELRIDRDISGTPDFFWVWDGEPKTVPKQSLNPNASGLRPIPRLTGHIWLRASPDSPLSDGIWYFHLIAVDKAGNVSEPLHYRFQVDTQHPKLSIHISKPLVVNRRPSAIHYTTPEETPPQTSSGEVQIKVVLSEQSVEPLKLFFQPKDKQELPLDLVAVESTPTEWHSKLRISPITGDGTGRFRFVAKDRAGNVGAEIVTGQELIIKTRIAANRTQAQYRICDDDTIVTIPPNALRADIHLYLERVQGQMRYRLMAWDSHRRALRHLTFAVPLQLQFPVAPNVPISAGNTVLTVFYDDGVKKHPTSTQIAGGQLLTRVSQTGEFLIASARKPTRKNTGGWATPNPFTPNNSGAPGDKTTFHVQTDAPFTIEIYNLTGQRVRTLRNGLNVWDGKDESGAVVEGGLYIYQIHAEDEVISGTVVVVK